MRDRLATTTKMTKKIGRTTKKFGGSGWEGLFSSPTLARLLTAFLTHPERAFYQRELIDAAAVVNCLISLAQHWNSWAERRPVPFQTGSLGGSRGADRALERRSAAVQ